MSQQINIPFRGKTIRITPSTRSPGVARVLKKTLLRAVRFPAATVVGFGLTGAAGAVFAHLPNTIPLLPATSFLCFFVGGLIYLFCSAFMILKEESLDHVNELLAIALSQSAKFSALMGLPLVALSYFLPEVATAYSSTVSFNAHLPYLLVGLGALFVAMTDTDALITWPLACDSGCPMTKGKAVVWTYLDDQAYRPYLASVAATAVASVFLMLPVFASLVPVLLAHLTVTIYSDTVTVDVTR